MSNNEDQTKDEAAGPEESAPAPPAFSDPIDINKALIAKLVDNTDGPQLRMRRKNKNKSGEKSLIDVSDDESASSGQASPASSVPRPFQKSNVLYEKKGVKKYRQQYEVWWREDEEERETRPPRGDPGAKN